jgi:hypothetical protein
MVTLLLLYGLLIVAWSAFPLRAAIASFARLTAEDGEPAEPPGR